MDDAGEFLQRTFEFRSRFESNRLAGANFDRLLGLRVDAVAGSPFTNRESAEAGEREARIFFDGFLQFREH